MDLKTYKKTIRTYTDEELRSFIELWGYKSDGEEDMVPMKTQLAERELERRRDSRESGTYQDETVDSKIRPQLRV